MAWNQRRWTSPEEACDHSPRGCPACRHLYFQVCHLPVHNATSSIPTKVGPLWMLVWQKRMAPEGDPIAAEKAESKDGLTPTCTLLLRAISLIQGKLSYVGHSLFPRVLLSF